MQYEPVPPKSQQPKFKHLAKHLTINVQSGYDQPHVQSSVQSVYNYAPITPNVARNPTFHELLQFSFQRSNSAPPAHTLTPSSVISPRTKLFPRSQVEQAWAIDGDGSHPQSQPPRRAFPEGHPYWLEAQQKLDHFPSTFGAPWSHPTLPPLAHSHGSQTFYNYNYGIQGFQQQQQQQHFQHQWYPQPTTIPALPQLQPAFVPHAHTHTHNKWAFPTTTTATRFQTAPPEANPSQFCTPQRHSNKRKRSMSDGLDAETPKSISSDEDITIQSRSPGKKQRLSPAVKLGKVPPTPPTTVRRSNRTKKERMVETGERYEQFF